jgi:hypothetical protein
MCRADLAIGSDLYESRFVPLIGKLHNSSEALDGRIGNCKATCSAKKDSAVAQRQMIALAEETYRRCIDMINELNSTMKNIAGASPSSSEWAQKFLSSFDITSNRVEA